MAWIKDEDWLEGEVVNDPEACIKKIKQEKLKADIFTFAQKLPNTKPNYDYPMEWDNVAAIPTTDFSVWWEHRLSSGSQKKCEKSSKARGCHSGGCSSSDQLFRA